MDKPTILREIEIEVPYPEDIYRIFRWCDRWCERCPHAQHCELHQAKPDNLHSDPEKFYETFAMVLDSTMERFEDYALVANDAKSAGSPIQNHPSVLKAHQYALQTKAWVETFAQKEPFVWKLLLQDSLIADSFDIIEWYLFLLEAKLIRALKAQKNKGGEGINHCDSLGNAKLVLVSIKQSIDAWGCLLQKFSNEEDFILKTLVDLQQLQRQVEDLFPEAENFVREGLDD